MTRRLWIGVALSVPIVILDMGGHFLGICTMLLPHGWLNWMLLVLATPVVLWAGWPFFVRGWQSLVTRNLNMFTLIALGTGTAWALQRRGHRGTRPVPRLVPAAMARSRSISNRPPSSPCLVLVGQVLELRARDSTSGAIKALLGLAPRTALKVGADGNDERSADRSDRRRRPSARAARREGAGRRRGDRRPQRRRRIHRSPASPCRSPRNPAPR